MSADLVIRGGTVIDGTGTPGYRADVAVRDGRIVEIGDGLSGSRVLEADGHVVAPGFIDIHTHYDAQVFWDPALTPSSWHGVTSVVAGNCGFTIAPCRPEHRELIGKTLQNVEDMNLATLQAGIPWEFETFPEYLDTVARHGTVLNYGAYVGHTALRLYVMGDEGYEREATDAELDAMAAVVREALLAGAVGFATTSAPTHNGEGGRPVPSRLADIREMEALVRPLRELGKGVGAFTPGERVKHPEVYELQKRIGRPFTWTALLTRHGTTFAQDMAAYTARQQAEGAEVYPQITCRPLTFQMNLRDPFTFNTNPMWQALMDRPVEERLAAYRDPEWRRHAQEELDTARMFRPKWSSMRIEEARDPSLEGRTVGDIAAERGIAPLDAMIEISIAEDLETRFRDTIANDDDDVIADLLVQDGLVLGLSDAGAHVGQLCDACLPTDLLGNWVREREVLTLERAVHKLTGEPARIYGFAGRGAIAEGACADVTVFDPDTVAPGPVRRVRDFPADGARLVADAPSGMRHVLVNGTPIRVDGAPDPDAVATRPGVVLR
ncbi:MAG: N-acyl-D-amino-acid deacylase family protein [Actinomycetota bacterium]